MSVRPADTSEKMWQRWLELQRKQPIGERLGSILDMCDLQRSGQLAGVKLRFPNADEDEVLFRLAELRYGAETARRRYDEPAQRRCRTGS